MAFYHKILFVIYFSILLPVFAVAQNQDFIYISGTLRNGIVSVDSIEQRVFNKSDIKLYTSGSYEAKILKGSKVINGNFFEIEENPEMWSEAIKKREEGVARSNTSTFNVKLPLTENLDTANSVIEIWKGGSLLYSKRLIELPVEVLAANLYAVTNPKNYPDLSYLFHLYYDNDKLVADRDFEFKYDVIPEVFISEILNTQFPYKGEIINLKGEIAETFQFDPRHGDPKFVKGKISVKAPYVADGQKVNFYDGQGSQLLSIFVSESSFCNDDGVCNADVGEDTATCPNDCKIATPVPTITTTPSTRDWEGMIKFLIYVIIGLGVVSGGWFGWKWWKRRQAPSLVELPSANLPPQ